MRTSLRLVIVLATLSVLHLPDRLVAQHDTEPTKSIEVIGCIDSVSLLDVLTSPPIPITRSLSNFQIGLNWYGMDGFSQMFGVGL